MSIAVYNGAKFVMLHCVVLDLAASRVTRGQHTLKNSKPNYWKVEWSNS